jgi:putative two-component system response regulator
MDRKRVLVVDDSTTMRQLECLILRDVELEIIEAKDGVEALAIAERDRPDIILLDVNMPGVDGRETFGRLRRMAGFEEVPVIFITGLAEDEVDLPSDANTARMTKPLYADALRSTVREMLGLPPQSTRNLTPR